MTVEATAAPDEFTTKIELHYATGQMKHELERESSIQAIAGAAARQPLNHRPCGSK